jgi:hypothetical protein
MNRRDRARELCITEIKAKEDYYGKDTEWHGSSICRDFNALFGISRINKQDLAGIVVAISLALNLPLDRTDKRNRKFLNGWLNSQYEQIGPILRQMAIVRPNGEVCGPMRNEFLKYQAEHPNSPFVVPRH